MKVFFIIFVKKLRYFSPLSIVNYFKLVEIKVLNGVLHIFKYLWLNYELKTKIVPRKSDKFRSPNMYFPQMAPPQLQTAPPQNLKTAGTPKQWLC